MVSSDSRAGQVSRQAGSASRRSAGGAAEPVVLSNGGAVTFLRQVAGTVILGIYLVVAGVVVLAPIVTGLEDPFAAVGALGPWGAALELRDGGLTPEQAIQIGGITVQTLGIAVGVSVALVIAAISGNRAIRVGDYRKLNLLAFVIGAATVSLSVVVMSFVQPPWTVSLQVVLLALLAVCLTGAVPARAKTSNERGREREVWRVLYRRRSMLGREYSCLTGTKGRAGSTGRARWRSALWWTAWILVGPIASLLAAAPLMIVMAIQGASWSVMADLLRVVMAFGIIMGFGVVTLAGDRWVSVPKDGSEVRPRARKISGQVALWTPVVALVSSGALLISVTRSAESEAPSSAYVLLLLWLIGCIGTSYTPLRWCIQAPEGPEQTVSLLPVRVRRLWSRGPLAWLARRLRPLRSWLTRGYLWLTYRRVNAQYARVMRQVRASAGPAPTIVDPSF